MKKVSRDRKGEGNKKHKSSHSSPMAGRGVSRPMMEADRGKTEVEPQSNDHGHSSSSMSLADRKEMLGMHHAQTLWIYWLLIILGVWLVMSPLTFSYDTGLVQPGGDRDVWLSLSMRIALMKWSDIVSGILLIFFGWRSLTPNRPYSLWICCFIGVWISMAPIVFWAPAAVAYLNSTLVGALVIAITVLIPGMPNMIMYMKMGSQVPSGWSYNPSSWPQRWIMIVTGFAGWLVSRYLAAFQLGYIDEVWDPFFGTSMQVLNSEMSRSFPISDAGLGTLAYTFEFLMGFMGSPARWRTMPWMVTLFGILVIPLGLVHIILVISQPVAVGAWCTFCLVAAAIMLPMIPLEIDEVIAMGQHMVQTKRKGEKFWRIFWKGGQPVESNTDERSPQLISLPGSLKAVFKASLWGMSFPWTLVLSLVLGIWVMVSPAAFGLGVETAAADLLHVGGALVIVTAVVSMGEVVRTARFFNVLLAVIIACGPWLVEGNSIAMNISCVVSGVWLIVLSLPRGIKKETYGLWDRYVK